MFLTLRNLAPFQRNTKGAQKRRRELLWESVSAMNLRTEERVLGELTVGICTKQKVRTDERLRCSEY
jgi:hypothetical protein